MEESNAYCHYHQEPFRRSAPEGEEDLWTLGNPQSSGLWIILAGNPGAERVLFMEVYVWEDCDNELDKFLYGIPLGGGLNRAHEKTHFQGGLVGFCEPSPENLCRAMEGMKKRIAEKKKRVDEFLKSRENVDS